MVVEVASEIDIFTSNAYYIIINSCLIADANRINYAEASFPTTILGRRKIVLNRS